MHQVTPSDIISKYRRLIFREDDPARGYIISTIFFVSGIVTLLQSVIGCRLPIIQGGTFTLVAPTLAILSLESKWSRPCPDFADEDLWENIGEEERQELWQERMREVQGAICVASLVQLVIGYTGLLGGLLRFITPLTIAPAVTMIGLSLFDVASLNASKHWGVAFGCV